MPRRSKKRRGEQIRIRVLLDNITVYENVGEAIESSRNSTRFRFPNDRIINLPDTEDDMKIVNRLLKDGIKLGS